MTTAVERRAKSLAVLPTYVLMDFVHCGIASTSVRTAHTTAAAVMSTDVWTSSPQALPQSVHDFANLDHPCEVDVKHEGST